MAKEISNEELFEFMTMMYSEMQDMKSNMTTKEDLSNLESRMATKEDLEKINQSIARLENKMDQNHKVLHDGYKQTYEKLTLLEEKVDEINKKVENHDVEIRVMKAVR